MSNNQLPSCFRPSSAADHLPSPTNNPNLTTSLYSSKLGLFALSWSRCSLFGRSLYLHHHHHYSDCERDGAIFHLHIKPFPWSYGTRKGSKKVNLNRSTPAKIIWDLSAAKYGSGPEPISGFHLAIVAEGEIVLLIGDSVPKEAYSSTKHETPSSVVLRREHVYGTKFYSTKAKIGEKERNISIDCEIGEDPKLCFAIDEIRVLEIKNLNWKFRGNDTIEIDGTCVQVSWDVYNWLFDQDGYALFMFTIFNEKNELRKDAAAAMLMLSQWNHQSFGFGFGFEEKKMKKRKGGSGLLMMRTGRSSSSSSLSSANSVSSCSSSVMEWANSDEDELVSFPHSGFSLLVYAWK